VRPGPRLPLALAAAGAVVALLDPFEPVGGFVGLGVMLAGAAPIVLGAPTAPGSATAPDWRRLLLAGTALAMVGIPLALLVETVGGLLAAIGAGAVIVAVALGFPAREPA
jgi:hypothetical protein